jgi:methionyl-tRNA formyltransferase
MSLRVAVVTQDEPFYLPLFFRSLFPALDDANEEVSVEWITVLDTFDESTLALARRTYRLYGPLNFVRRGLEYAARRLADAVGARSYSVASVADCWGVPVEYRSSVNTESFVDRLERSDVDVVLSVSAPELFDKAVLEAPEWGCLNVHTAKLPEYRGMLPTFWALYHGEETVGVTVHTMVEEIDQGRIVRQTTFPVGSEATLDDVITRGKREGGALAAAALRNISSGTETLSPIEGEGSYFSFPTVEDRREFQRRGGELL